MSLGVDSMDDLRHAAECLDAFGVQNGGVVELPALNIAVLSFLDPDDINLELVTSIG